MITARNHILRLLSVLMIVSVLLGVAPVVGDTVEVLTIDNVTHASAPVKPQTVTTIQKQSTQETKPEKVTAYNPLPALPFVIDVLGDEIDAIITYAKGEDPNEGKSVDEKGQNTRSNVALTLIFMVKNAKAVRSLRFELVPFENQKDVYELCAFYKTVFGKDEQQFRTGVLHDYNTQTIYTVDGTGILGIGYDFNFDFNEFISSADPWQRDFGFCKSYDQLAFLIGDVYNTIRVPFNYDGIDWMIQLWKGVYSFNMLGGEIGIYTKPMDRQAGYYDCATDAERMKMSFEIKQGDEIIVSTPTELKWWQTRFAYNRWANPSKLTMSGTIQFPSKGMMNAFAESLTLADSSVSYTTNGTTLSFTWSASK